LIQKELELNFEKRFSSAWFKFRINTWRTNSNDLFDIAAQSSRNIRHNRQDAARTEWEVIYKDNVNKKNVKAAKVTTKEIKDISVLKDLLSIVWDPNSTDKKLMNFIEEN
jgi:hypothetical protein